ncbi:hypothetical protein AB6G44_12335 [Enterobacter hormaechei]
MPVNIFDIPQEKAIIKKKWSLWLEVGFLFCMITFYVYVFLIYFPEYLSKNPIIFWVELLLIPLIIACIVFFFRIVVWNSENIEAVSWNEHRAAYYRELLQKGRINLDIVELQIRLPDLNGSVDNVVKKNILPVRYTPRGMHMARYLSFYPSKDELINDEWIKERKVDLFNGIVSDLINDIYMHIKLLPANTKVKVVCILDDDLKALAESIWRRCFDNVFPFERIDFSNDLSKSIDNWLDSYSDGYIVLIAASFYSTELISENIADKSESVVFLLGRLNGNGKITNASSLGDFFRPEFDWTGIDKSLVWGGVNEESGLSGVIYSGLNQEEVKRLVLKTSDYMTESALSAYTYIDSGNYLGICSPLTVFLQLKYVNEYLLPGKYLFVNKSNDLLVSHFFSSIADR